MKPVKLAFECYGDRSRSPLIIIHGFFASSRNWRQMAKRLAEDYCVYVLDMRNHGLSPHAPEMDYPIMAEDLKSFMDEHQLATAKILGHSMGGKVAMWFALHHPERIQHLIVADISPVTYQHSFDHTINALKQLPLNQISNRKQADEFLSSAIPELSYRQFLLQNLQLKDGSYSWRINLDIFYHTADNIIAFPDLESVLPFMGKVLFIMGGNSNYTNKEAIGVCFSNAEIAVLENVNHWLHVDAPEEFLTKTLGFLQKN
ncbi:MAG: alpha/beta fold hydrolase [Methylococcales bacterium]|nr:alpha/beta fold hydrolase [Methylococcales bacterium]